MRQNIDSTTVAHNTISDCTVDGIFQGMSCSHNRIVRNDVSGCKHGIKFGAVADRIICADNTLYNSSLANLTGDGLLTNSIVQDNVT